jgi:hypothetical protein
MAGRPIKCQIKEVKIPKKFVILAGTRSEAIMRVKRGAGNFVMEGLVRVER